MTFHCYNYNRRSGQTIGIILIPFLSCTCIYSNWSTNLGAKESQKFAVLLNTNNRHHLRWSFSFISISQLRRHQQVTAPSQCAEFNCSASESKSQLKTADWEFKSDLGVDIDIHGDLTSVEDRIEYNDDEEDYLIKSYMHVIELERVRRHPTVPEGMEPRWSHNQIPELMESHLFHPLSH